MAKLKIAAASTVFVFLLVFINSCSQYNIKDYRESSFSALISFTVKGTEYRSNVVYAAENEDIRMEFVSPHTLSGIVLLRRAGEWQIEYSELALPCEMFSDARRYAEMLIADGQIQAICETELGGREAIFCTLGDKALGETVYELYIDKSTKEPMEIRGENRVAYILEFEFI